MKPEYLRRIKRFSEEFVKDVIDTTNRIHKKDGKAYPFRIQRSVSRRWASCPRYKITLLLNYLEHIGMFSSRLEEVEEYRERMRKYKGLYERGARRKYFYPSDGVPKTIDEYRKISHAELGIKKEKIWEYPT